MSDYFKTDMLSNSSIQKLLQSPLAYLQRNDIKETPAMQIGTAFHTFILENDKFFDNYVIKPDGMNFVTKDGKAWRDEQTKIIIDSDVYENFQKQYENIYKHPYSYLLRDGEIEIEKEVYFNYNGVECKMKIDLYNKTHNTIIDLKSIADCSKSENATRYDYLTQSVFYRIGMQSVNDLNFENDFYFVFSEKANPFGCKWIELSEQTTALGLEKIHKAMEIYNKLRNNELWYLDYSENIITV